jgi:dTDP-4-amino-4,6-dideoxygalactose transaminase
MKAFDIVAMFEEELAEFAGSAYAVAVDSCTNALFLSLLYERRNFTITPSVEIPKNTYVGVGQVALNAGYVIDWVDEQWHNLYPLRGTRVWDAAKYLERGMYPNYAGSLMCVSFHIAKSLPLGRGGAIFVDDAATAEWLKRARFDGRTQGETGENATRITLPGYHMYMTPPEAARALWLLETMEQEHHGSWEHYPDISELLG